MSNRSASLTRLLSQYRTESRRLRSALLSLSRVLTTSSIVSSSSRVDHGSVRNWYFCCFIVTYSWLPVNTRSEYRSNAIANGRYPFHRPLVVYFPLYSNGTVRLSNTAISPSSFVCLARLDFGVVSLIPNSFDLFCSTLDLSLIHIWRCRRSTLCRSRWSPYH